ncbi:hypothetical protein DPMN_166879 [Dreissena polymorpha]|uniref:Uncharacterized protein n=1 Tax=Dreissena polymorpha TaxID=45954 RepID=A0A9D4EZQ2_DREPO|nr:hypothetical protein DPMN_166879 [Dreissena polymorpha]
MLSAVTLLLLVSCCGMALGQWGGDLCRPVYPPWNCIAVLCAPATNCRYGSFTPKGHCCSVCIGIEINTLFGCIFTDSTDII